MNVLYVTDKGSNCWYMANILDELEDAGCITHQWIKLTEYLKTDQSDFDVLVYQTFPSEEHKSKFNKGLIKQSDELFVKFKGKRFLLDSFDCCDRNGYTRFPSGWPRIKVCATESYKSAHNCVFALPAFSMNWFIEKEKFLNLPRYTPIHCAFKIDPRYPHRIRNAIKDELLTDFLDFTAFNKVPFDDYLFFLNLVKISVVGPGYGQTSHSSYHTLQAGACLFHHESIKEIKLLPHVDLIPDVDYVWFDMNNFTQKLQYLLDNPDLTKTIGESGQIKFFEGINIDKSCEQMLEIFRA